MKINISDSFTSEDALYEFIIRLLQDLKLSMGPQALYATLRRHKKVYNFLIEYQSRNLQIIEDHIDDFLNS